MNYGESVQLHDFASVTKRTKYCEFLRASMDEKAVLVAFGVAFMQDYLSANLWIWLLHGGLVTFRVALMHSDQHLHRKKVIEFLATFKHILELF